MPPACYHCRRLYEPTQPTLQTFLHKNFINVIEKSIFCSYKKIMLHMKIFELYFHMKLPIFHHINDGPLVIKTNL